MLLLRTWEKMQNLSASTCLEKFSSNSHLKELWLSVFELEGLEFQLSLPPLATEH